MSKVFYDHLIALDKLEKKIKEVAVTLEEKTELWRIVDEIIHHRIIGCLLDKLPREDHEEFLSKFHAAPYDTGLIKYLNSKIKEDVKKIVREEIFNLTKDLLRQVKTSS